MADTCVLGHAWTQGRVLCQVCGFGPRAAPVAAQAAAPQLAQAAPVQQLAASVPVAVSVAAGGGRPVAEPVLSPDGQWTWDGAQWQPTGVEAAPVPPERAAVSHEHVHHAAKRRVSPALLLVLVLAVGAVAGDYLLKLPPLGHKAAAPAPVVVHHAVVKATGKPGRASAAVGADLARVAGAEARAYAATNAFVSDAAVLRKDGATATSGDLVLVAAKGPGYCAVVGTSQRWYVLNSHFSGTLGSVVYATPAAAESTCPAGLGGFTAV